MVREEVGGTDLVLAVGELRDVGNDQFRIVSRHYGEFDLNMDPVEIFRAVLQGGMQ